MGRSSRRCFTPPPPTPLTILIDTGAVKNLTNGIVMGVAGRQRDGIQWRTGNVPRAEGGTKACATRSSSARGGRARPRDRRTVALSPRPFTVTLQSGERHEARALVVATGAKAKLLGLPGEQRLMGRGGSTCATRDGVFFRHRDAV